MKDATDPRARCAEFRFAARLVETFVLPLVTDRQVRSVLVTQLQELAETAARWDREKG